jgi:hypothetical protein
MRCLNIRLIRSRRNETKASSPDGIGYNIVVAARCVDDQQRAAPPIKGPQGALNLIPVSDPFDKRFWAGSAGRPV